MPIFLQILGGRADVELLSNTGNRVHVRREAGVEKRLHVVHVQLFVVPGVVWVFEERAVVLQSVVHELVMIADADSVSSENLKGRVREHDD